MERNQRLSLRRDSPYAMESSPLPRQATADNDTPRAITTTTITTSIRKISSNFPRLPPDGHEFPQNYQELVFRKQPEKAVMEIPPPYGFHDISEGSSRKKVCKEADDTDLPPPPLPGSSPPRLKPALPIQADFSSKRFQRQDEKSEKSVKDKIAMFSSVNDTVPLVPKPLGRPLDDLPKSNLSRSMTQEDVRKPFETGSLPRGTRVSNQSKAFAPKPVEKSWVREKTNLHERSQSLIDLAVGFSSSKRHSMSSIANVPDVDQMRKVSLSTLIEQRRKSICKLRGLVIPEKPEVQAQSTSSASVIDLPKIISRESIIVAQAVKTTPSMAKPACPDSTDSVSTPWQVPAVEIPKYSPAFKRKPFAVYKAQPVYSGEDTKAKKAYVPPAEPKSLESIASPHSDVSFEFSSPTPEEAFSKRKPPVLFPSPPPVKMSSPKLPQLASKRDYIANRTDDSDNDSAVSSSRSSISHGISPPLSPTPESGEKPNLDDSKRVLKAQSVEAINRKNVLHSAKYRSGKAEAIDSPEISRRFQFEGEIEADDEDGSSPESSTSELEPSSYSSGHLLESTEDEHTPSYCGIMSPGSDGPRSLPLFSSDNPVQSIQEMELHMAYVNEVCDDYVGKQVASLPTMTSYSRDITSVAPQTNVLETKETNIPDNFLKANDNVEADIDSLEKTVAQMMTMDTPSEDRWSKLTKKYEKAPEESPQPLPAANSLGRGRTFRALAEKWQLMSDDSPSLPIPPQTNRPQKAVEASKSEVDVAREVRKSTPPPEVVSVERKVVTNSDNGDSEQLKPQERKTFRTVPSRSQTGVDVEKTEVPSEERQPLARPRETLRRFSDKITEIKPLRESTRSCSVQDIRKAFDKTSPAACNGKEERSSPRQPSPRTAHARMSSQDSTASEDSTTSAATHAIYGSMNSLGSMGSRDPFGSVTSLASTTSLLSPQELQQLVDEANHSTEEPQLVLVITLQRECSAGGIGITLAGGADHETKEITVHRVISGSIAAKDGRVQKGDRVLSINGRSTKDVTHREALNLLKAPRPEVVLIISRNREAQDSLPQVTREVPVLSGHGRTDSTDTSASISGTSQLSQVVTLNKEGGGLGFSLEGGKDSPLGDRPLVIKKIFIGGVAEKSGSLQVGDEILSLNGMEMSAMSRIEAWNFMKKLPDGDVKLAIRRKRVKC